MTTNFHGFDKSGNYREGSRWSAIEGTEASTELADGERVGPRVVVAERDGFGNLTLRFADMDSARDWDEAVRRLPHRGIYRDSQNRAAIDFPEPDNGSATIVFGRAEASLGERADAALEAVFATVPEASDVVFDWNNSGAVLRTALRPSDLGGGMYQSISLPDASAGRAAELVDALLDEEDLRDLVDGQPRNGFSFVKNPDGSMQVTAKCGGCGGQVGIDCFNRYDHEHDGW